MIEQQRTHALLCENSTTATPSRYDCRTPTHPLPAFTYTSTRPMYRSESSTNPPCSNIENFCGIQQAFRNTNIQHSDEALLDILSGMEPIQNNTEGGRVATKRTRPDTVTEDCTFVKRS